VLKTVGGGLVVGTVSVAPASAQSDELSHQLNTVRAVTRKYKDIETARSDGYIAVSPYVPGMGFHFAQLTDDPPTPDPIGTDLEDPGVLVYYTNGSYNPNPGEPHELGQDDGLILGGAEWLVRGDQEVNPRVSPTTRTVHEI
jgi:hypothetical protein